MTPPPSLTDESSLCAKEPSYQPKDYLDARCALRMALRRFLVKCREAQLDSPATDETLIGVKKHWLVSLDHIHHQLSVNNTSVPITYYHASVNGRDVIASRPFVFGGSSYTQNAKWRSSVAKVELPFLAIRQALPQALVADFKYATEWNDVLEKFNEWLAIASYFKEELLKENTEARIAARIATSATSRVQSKGWTSTPTSSGTTFSPDMRTLNSTKPS